MVVNSNSQGIIIPASSFNKPCYYYNDSGEDPGIILFSSEESCEHYNNKKEENQDISLIKK